VRGAPPPSPTTHPARAFRPRAGAFGLAGR
jgi:hypothetical protein